MGFFSSLARYFDGRERESAPEGLDDADARNGLLGAGLTFKGEVSGEGDLFIAGSFEGEINVTGTVRVGDNAEVEANISAGTIVIAGAVRGNVSVTTHVEMLPSGTLTGTDYGVESLANSASITNSGSISGTSESSRMISRSSAWLTM